MRKNKKEDKDYIEILNNSKDNNLNTIKNKINKIIINDIKITSKNDSQIELINSIKNNEITICAGPAGTGKTFITLAYALNFLQKQNNKYNKIYLVKSVTTLKNEEIGFLKGDMKDKIDPFMWSYYINFEKIISKSTLDMLLNDEIIVPFPLAYMRGASLDNCIIIADEMQNVSLDNSRTLLTRIGSDSKLILLGDFNQIDIKNKEESSLEILLKIFENTENIGTVHMSESDTNVRNPIINIIENKFNEYYNNNNNNILTNKNKKKIL